MKKIEKKELIPIEKRKGIKILYPDYIKEREKDNESGQRVENGTVNSEKKSF